MSSIRVSEKSQDEGQTLAGDVPNDYLKDFNYLRDLSEKGSLQASNSIYKKLDQKAKALPGLRRALDSLSVKY